MRLIPDNIDWEAYVKDEDDGRANVRPAGEFIEQLIEKLHGEKSDEVYGLLTPWASVGTDIAFRPGEVTLWGGVNGHGKSAVLGYAMLHGMSAGERVCIASMEMKPVDTLDRLCRQAACVEKATGQFLSLFGKWTNDRLWVYNHVGTVQRDRMLAVSRYCRRELGVNHMVIDSLLKCGIAPDDYAGQKNFVDALCSLARDTDLHIHLVHHARKSEKESNVPDKFDLKGAGEITDLVDNVLIVHRNKAKEADLRKDLTPEKREIVSMQADTVLICAKQRHYTWEGTIKLWFDQASLQFRDQRTGGAACLDMNDSQWKPLWGNR